MNKIAVAGSLHYDIMIDAHHRPEKGETVMGTACRYKFGGKGGTRLSRRPNMAQRSDLPAPLAQMNRDVFWLKHYVRRALTRAPLRWWQTRLRE